MLLCCQTFSIQSNAIDLSATKQVIGLQLSSQLKRGFGFFNL